jgi:N6-L-threonylcarbamoyladenine synthase
MSMVLGLDTSCYTTSLALAQDGRLIAQQRRLLKVEKGERGLQQSAGVFQHMKNLPDLMEALFKETGPVEIEAVCASARPRPNEDSYMPVFLAGVGLARSVAALKGVPLRLTSHQQGHVRAAMVDAGLPEGEPFLAVHLSGGTTELLRVDGLNIDLLGGSKDLHAGQFVDRAGVKMGLGFPAGPELERLAMQGSAQSVLPSWVRGMDCSFSGAETQIQRLIERGEHSREDLAAEVFSCIARTLAKMLGQAVRQTGLKHILLSGGVASSTYLREIFPGRMARERVGAKLHWGRPELSGDNAAGVALIGSEWQNWYPND